MTANIDLRRVNLHLFSGEGAGGTAGGGTAAPADGGTGDAQASSDPTRQSSKTGDLSKVQYGKQAPETGAGGSAAKADKDPAAGGPDVKAAAAAALDAQNKAFDDLINGEYKDIYTKRTQDMIDRRFAKAKAAEAENGKLREIADMLGQKYGITEDSDFSKLRSAIESDSDIWEAAAEEHGMTVEQYRKFSKLERENAAFQAARQNDLAQQQQREKAQKWYAEAQELKTRFPQFDLQTELADRNFVAAINAGVPMEQVYKGKYYDQFVGEAAQSVAKSTEKALVDNIRAKGKRPAENGIAAQSASFLTKSDPSKLTLADFDEIARRVAHGDIISF